MSMIRFSLTRALVAVACLMPHLSDASWYAAPFAADIVMVNPADPKDRANGKLFVGSDRFRSEGVYQGTKKVLIVNMADRKAYTLIPDKKEYYEGLSEALMPPRPDVERMPNDPQGPCKSDPQLSCSQGGQEIIHGIASEKWSVKATSKEGGGYGVTLWVDPQRRIVIRQQPDQGPLMERKLLGVEKIDGRDTEKWEFVHSFKEQRNSYLQWIDSALRLPVRMGEGRQANMELSAIREGSQDAALFQVPTDFKQVNPPPPPSAQGPDGKVNTPPPPTGGKGVRYQ
ncbi:MAG: hypothetical protein G8237_01010 [Magnetococcales bacterium]|nr:hypothetical protein [Magnetococcales bacterium]NGZ04916.1 hypothetical protein [Magnetococcales bacterium]